jgi:ABC-2 type transport system ATP-binding protein
VLDLAGSLCGLSRPHRRRRSAELLAALRLEATARTPLRKLSKGLVQRVGIAQAIVHDPELLILDEPMSGLDPLGRRDVRDLIDNLRARGRTVFFSTHIGPDVEAICDRVGILNRGRLVAVGRIEELTTVRLHAVEVLIRNVPAELVARLLGSEDARRARSECACSCTPALIACRQVMSGGRRAECFREQLRTGAHRRRGRR